MAARRRPPAAGLAQLAAGQLSFLGAAAATDRTGRLYARRAGRFAERCLRQGLSWTSAAELDVMLAAFLGRLALDGFDAATGRVAVAALRHIVLGMLGGRRNFAAYKPFSTALRPAKHVFLAASPDKLD